jgi:hypothetical protein
VSNCNETKRKSIEDFDRLVTIGEQQRGTIGRVPNVATHALNRLDWFGDEQLVDLFDHFPRNRLRVWQSRANLKNFTDWEPVDTTGVSGHEMLECLYKGSLWFNFQRIDLVDRRFDSLSSRLYREIGEQSKDFSVDFIHSYLLVSSPNAMVYLHLDAYENMLFVIRGNKKFYLYPPADSRMIALETLEDICAGGEDFFEYHAEFDNWAKTFSIGPGQFFSWPQHSPHRTSNNDELSVSLGTFHGTRAGIKRVEQLTADRYFRTSFPTLPFATAAGKLLDVKRFGYRVARRLGGWTFSILSSFFTRDCTWAALAACALKRSMKRISLASIACWRA